MKFKQFLAESDEMLESIKKILQEMDSEELDDFGTFLVDMFLEDLPDDEYEEEFDLEDIMEMIEALGMEFYDEILDELSDIEDDWDEDQKELDEAVSRILKSKNYNRKKRKYMSTSRSELRKTKASRRKEARKTKSQRKRYYKANKAKIASYQKSRREAIKKGKHKVKQRRSA